MSHCERAVYERVTSTTTITRTPVLLPRSMWTTAADMEARGLLRAEVVVVEHIPGARAYVGTRDGARAYYAGQAVAA